MYTNTIKNSKLRIVSGWIVITIGCVVGLYMTFNLLLLSYNVFIAITQSSREIDWIVTVGRAAIKTFTVYLCYEAFRWGRHLTRPGSTEYV